MPSTMPHVHLPADLREAVSIRRAGERAGSPRVTSWWMTPLPRSLGPTTRAPSRSSESASANGPRPAATLPQEQHASRVSTPLFRASRTVDIDDPARPDRPALGVSPGHAQLCRAECADHRCILRTAGAEAAGVRGCCDPGEGLISMEIVMSSYPASCRQGLMLPFPARTRVRECIRTLYM